MRLECKVECDDKAVISKASCLAAHLIQRDWIVSAIVSWALKPGRTSNVSKTFAEQSEKEVRKTYHQEDKRSWRKFSNLSLLIKRNGDKNQRPFIEVAKAAIHTTKYFQKLGKGACGRALIFLSAGLSTIWYGETCRPTTRQIFGIQGFVNRRLSQK